MGFKNYTKIILNTVQAFKKILKYRVNYNGKIKKQFKLQNLIGIMKKKKTK